MGCIFVAKPGCMNFRLDPSKVYITLTLVS